MEIEKKALTLYPVREKTNKKGTGTFDPNLPRRRAYQQGYEQAVSDLTARTIDTRRGKYNLIPDGEQTIAVYVGDNDERLVFDKPIARLGDWEVKQRINELYLHDNHLTTVQEELISEIEALVEEYIFSDETYQDLYKELNWQNIGEDGDDFRLNIEIRKNP